MNLSEILKMLQKKSNDPPQAPAPPPVPVYWVETSDSVSHHFQFEPDGQLSVKIVDDARPASRRMVESFLNKFFPSGYPYSVNEGYLRYTQFRALQHFSSATLSVLSTQSLLFAAGLRPTPAQATAVSWILKDGMQHVGKLICSNLGARMDSEPKCWRILADVLYDFGTGLEVISPLCPHLFLEMAGLGNFAKGMAVVAARATRLPIYSSFAKEGNLSDLFAKGEAISTLFNVLGIGAGIQLASTVCTSMQGKLVVGPLLSLFHIYCVTEEMRATPVNTLNPQRTAMIVADFIKRGRIPSPADLRYQEDLLFPGRLIEEAGSVKVGRPLHNVVKPSQLHQVKEKFPEEKFILNRGTKWTDMILERNATGEDALKGWLVAAYAAEIEKTLHQTSSDPLEEAYERTVNVFSPFLSELQAKGWHTDRFLDGTGRRFAL
ncbi:protein root UVB sensitive 2, chloroplastic [Sesamum angolense]|uniref:Protein root UVB sensitive 2, chloroplastic n=1 Tax=Sesamum angolense TaxID=2727404 RepID=A0AAE1X8E4_9LAMI|nr:protein root UVB sensitive 2, chloroplastic [Sesamum angolense]